MGAVAGYNWPVSARAVSRSGWKVILVGVAAGVAAATGCGRIGYDASGLGDDGSLPGVDAAPGDGAAPVPDTDGGAPKPPPPPPDSTPFGTDEVRVTSSRGKSLHPALAWSGGALYVVWDDARGSSLDIYLARLTPSGRGDLHDVRLTDESSASGFPAAAWGGDHVAVAWEDNRAGNSDIYFGWFDPAGRRVGDEVAVTSSTPDAYDPAIAWSGSEHGIAYHEGNETHTEVLLRRVSTEPLGRAVVRSDGPAMSQFVSMAWTGSTYGLIWQDTRDGATAGYFGALSSSGNAPGSDVRATSSQSRVSRPALAWGGDVYGTAWADSRGGRSVIYFTHLTPSGSRVGPEAAVSTGSGDAVNPSVVWTGQQFGVVWEQGGEIQLAVLDDSGARVRGPEAVSDSGGHAAEPALVWMSDQFGVAWQDARDGEEEIYVRAVDR